MGFNILTLDVGHTATGQGPVHRMKDVGLLMTLVTVPLEVMSVYMTALVVLHAPHSAAHAHSPHQQAAQARRHVPEQTARHTPKAVMWHRELLAEPRHVLQMSVREPRGMTIHLRVQDFVIVLALASPALVLLPRTAAMPDAILVGIKHVILLAGRHRAHAVRTVVAVLAPVSLFRPRPRLYQLTARLLQR